MRGTQPHLRGVTPFALSARFSCHPEVLRGVRLACSACLGMTVRRCSGNAIFGGLSHVRPSRRAMLVGDPMRSVPFPWAQRKCVSNSMNGRRFARAPVPPARHSWPTRIFRVFFEVGLSDREKNACFLRVGHVGQVGQLCHFTFVGILEKCVTDFAGYRRFALGGCRASLVAPRSGERCVPTRSVGTSGEFSKNGRSGFPA
jgi:hypothetical protein